MSKLLVRKVYLYLFSLVGLVLITIGTVRLVTLGLKIYVFTKADQVYNYPQARPVELPNLGVAKNSKEMAGPTQSEIGEFQKNQLASNRERDAAESLAMIIIGLPLYIYHWSVIKKDKEE